MHQRIRSYMEQHGTTVKEVAQKARMPEQELAAMLCGEKTLYADELRMICLALNVSPEAFVEE